MSITTQQKTAAAFYTALKTAIGSSVGNRVFEQEAPQNASLPLCRYQIISDVINNKLTCSDEEITIQVNFFGEKKYGVKSLRDISDVLFKALNLTNLTIAGVTARVEGIEQGVVTIEDNTIINIRQEYIIKII